MRVRLRALLTASLVGAAVLLGVTSAGTAVGQPASPTFADTFQVDGRVA